MKKKILNIPAKVWISAILGVLCVVLAASAVAVVMMRDKEAPVITFDTEAKILKEARAREVLDGNLEVLLNGVTAEDTQDGDLTDLLYVRSTVLGEQETYMIATYQVADRAGNVAQKKRVIYLKNPRWIYDEIMLAKKKLLDKQKEEEEAANAAAEYEAHRPHITMESIVDVPVGGSFNIIDYVIDVGDDYDTDQMLFENGRIIGEYDLFTPGEYSIAVIVRDTMGYDSEPAFMLLRVS